MPGSVCEERLDDLSQFVTGKSRIQLLHDAIKIGKAVRDAASNLGELIVGMPEAVNTTPTSFRGAKVCSKWLQERIDDHNIQSDNKYKSGL